MVFHNVPPSPACFRLETFLPSPGPPDSALAIPKAQLPSSALTGSAQLSLVPRCHHLRRTNPARNIQAILLLTAMRPILEQTNLKNDAYIQVLHRKTRKHTCKRKSNFSSFIFHGKKKIPHHLVRQGIQTNDFFDPSPAAIVYTGVSNTSLR